MKEYQLQIYAGPNEWGGCLREICFFAEDIFAASVMANNLISGREVYRLSEVKKK